MACSCCPEYTEEELLSQLAQRRLAWEADWQRRDEEERRRDHHIYVKSMIHLKGLVSQIQSRMERRIALTQEVERQQPEGRPEPTPGT
jgi:hypothetical protein